MRHFVQYHNPEKTGPYHYPRRGETFGIVTDKPVDSLMGDRVWLVTRDGTPLRYRLCETHDNTLAGFTEITGPANQMGANVYNAAAFVSPLPSSAGTPRFLLLGGQAFTPGAPTVPSPVSAAVYVNTAP